MTLVSNLHRGILSPLLSNVVLHELDLFVTDLINKQNERLRGVPTGATNKEYGKSTYQISKYRAAIKKAKEDGVSPPSVKVLSKSLKKIVKKRLKTPRIIESPSYIRFDYVRYADDWLIGVWGPVSFVKGLKTKISERAPARLPAALALHAPFWILSNLNYRLQNSDNFRRLR